MCGVATSPRRPAGRILTDPPDVLLTTSESLGAILLSVKVRGAEPAVRAEFVAARLLDRAGLTLPGTAGAPPRHGSSPPAPPTGCATSP